MSVAKLSVSSNKGVELELHDGRYLVMRIDLTQDHGPSGSGASNIVGSANGPLGKSGVRVNCNVYVKKGKVFNAGGLKTVEFPEMNNMAMSLEDKVLVVKVDLTEEGTQSKSSDTMLIGSTGGSRAIGKSNVTMGINITHNPKNTKDLSQLHAAQGDNFTINPRDGDVVSFSVDTTKQAPGTSKGGRLVVSTTSGIAHDATGLSFNATIYSKDPKAKFEQVKQQKPVNAKARGLTFTHVGNKLTVFANASADFGETTSGASTMVGTATGPMDGCNCACSISIFKRIAGRPSSGVNGGGAEKTSSQPATYTHPQYEKLKSTVKKYLDKTDGDIKVSAVLKTVADKRGWEITDLLKKMVKKAINEVLAEEEDEEGEEEDAASEGSARKRKREGGDHGEGPPAKK